jgi:hypothetical protein
MRGCSNPETTFTQFVHFSNFLGFWCFWGHNPSNQTPRIKIPDPSLHPNTFNYFVPNSELSWLFPSLQSCYQTIIRRLRTWTVFGQVPGSPAGTGVSWWHYGLPKIRNNRHGKSFSEVCLLCPDSKNRQSQVAGTWASGCGEFGCHQINFEKRIRIFWISMFSRKVPLSHCLIWNPTPATTFRWPTFWIRTMNSSVSVIWKSSEHCQWGTHRWRFQRCGLAESSSKIGWMEALWTLKSCGRQLKVGEKTIALLSKFRIFLI